MVKYNYYNPSPSNGTLPWKKFHNILSFSKAVLLITALVSSSPGTMSWSLVTAPFIATTTTTRMQSFHTKTTTSTATTCTTSTQHHVMMMAAKGGFGGSSTSSSGQGNVVKLKPKSQWDRYLSITTPPIRVAVRILGEEQEEWLEVGWIKHLIEENLSVEMAVARQRALIAEVRRIVLPTLPPLIILCLVSTSLFYLRFYSTLHNRFYSSMPNDCFHSRYVIFLSCFF
jgi:hypothetical protein